ncbi:MAG: hypothetical protein SangKO_011780 [Sandaracinaceae bacterium]
MMQWLRVCGYAQAVSRAMKSVGLSPGVSWQDKIEAVASAKTPKKVDAAFRHLVEDVALFGRKSATVAFVDVAVAKRLRTWAQGQKSPTWSLRLPTSTEMSLVGAVRQPGGVHSVVYRSLRELRFKEDLDLGQALRVSVRQGLLNPVRLIAVQEHTIAAYDVIDIHSDGRLVFRIADEFQQYQSTRSKGEKTFPMLLRDALEGDSLVDLSAAEFVDLLPAVRALYDAGGEGRVVEVNFTCGTGAVRSPTLRRGVQDLRTEVFQKAGIEAVGSIDPYGVAVAWAADEQSNLDAHASRKANGEPFREFELLVKKGRGLKTAPRAQIHKAWCAAEYNYALERLFAYLPVRGNG